MPAGAAAAPPETRQVRLSCACSPVLQSSCLCGTAQAASGSTATVCACSSCRVSAMQSTSFTVLERPCACSAAGMRVAICQSDPITKLPPPGSLASVTMLTACAGSLSPSQSLPFNWSQLPATNASMSSSPSLLHCCNKSCAFLHCQVLCLSALPSPVPFCTAKSCAFLHCCKCLCALPATNASMSSSPSLLHCKCLCALPQQALCQVLPFNWSQLPDECQHV